MLKYWYIGLKQPDNKKIFIWNLLGSGIYAAASMLLIYITIFIVGAEEGGIFAIGLTLAQMFVYIAFYETRNYMVTDAKSQFSFSDYHIVKIINCVIMMIICVLYVFLKKYDTQKILVVLLTCSYRMLDGYADLYEGQFHKEGRLDLAGKSMAFRTILSVSVYFFVLYFTKCLLCALAFANISGVIGIIVFDIIIYNGIKKNCSRWNKENICNIWKDCFPLFIGMFLWAYLLSAPRIAVDNVMNSAEQSYFQLLFLPVSVINLFAGFLIRPSLMNLTEYYATKNMSMFWRVIHHIIYWLILITLVCMGLAYLMGIPILEIFSKSDLSAYKLLFVFLIFAGYFNSVGYLCYHILTIFRCQMGIIIGYMAASVCAFLISDNMTREWGMWGASVSYLISVIVLLCAFVIYIWRFNYAKDL